MELTLSTVVVLLILLIATLIFASIMLGWGGEATTWLNSTFTPFQNLVLRR
jgi:hypothetical protein